MAHFEQAHFARIDVLIPVFNCIDTVEESIDSILKQTFNDIRVIIVDDGSTDGTSAILEKIKARDSRVVVISQPNGGIVRALNTGLAACDAPYIARHDGDDIAYPDRFEVQVAYLDSHSECIAVGANARHIDAAGAPIGTFTNMKDTGHADAAWYPAREPHLMHPLLMVRREALVDVGGYRYVFHAEDADLYWRLLQVGTLHNLPNVLADYRIHGESISGRSIVNGRIAAIYSQMAALSYARRESGLPDIAFPSDVLAALMAGTEVDEMISVAGSHLDDIEMRHLVLATATKLVELVQYRPYQLRDSDWSFVRHAINVHGLLMRKANLAEFKQRSVWYVAKLLSRGAIKPILHGAPKSLLAPVVLHILRGRLSKIADKLARLTPRGGHCGSGRASTERSH